MIENRSDKKLRILETSERRGEVSKIAAGRTEPEKALPRPDPEVPAKATRRRFSARYFWCSLGAASVARFLAAFL